MSKKNGSKIFKSVYTAPFLVSRENRESGKCIMEYPVQSDNEEYTAMIFRNTKENNYIMYKDGEKFFEQLSEFSPSVSNCMFFDEIIVNSRPFRMFMDIEREYNGVPAFSPSIINDIHNCIIRSVSSVLNELYGFSLSTGDVMITDASNQSKFSRHYVFRSVYYTDVYKLADDIETIISKIPSGFSGLIDTGVYKPNHAVRCVYSDKISGKIPVGRPFIPVTTVSDIRDYYITYPYDQYIRGLSVIQQLDGLLLVEETSDRTLTNSPGVLDESEITGDVLEEIEKYIPADFSVRDISRNLVILDRKKPGYCEICNRVHEHDGGMMILVRKILNGVQEPTAKLYFKCRQSPKGSKKLMAKLEISSATTTTKKKKEKSNYLEWKTNKIIDMVKELRESITDKPSGETVGTNGKKCINISSPLLPSFAELCVDERDITIIRSPMGSGKTYQLLKYIEETESKIGRNLNIVMVSFRQSFTENKVLDFHAIDYRSTVGPIRVSEKPVIIQFDSLKRLVLDKTCPVIDLLILDESESIFNQMTNNLMSDNNSVLCMNNFVKLVNISAKTIAMDANDTGRTERLLSFIKGSGSINLVNNSVLLNKYDVEIYQNHTQLTKKVLDLVSSGKRLVIPCLKRKKANILAEKIRSDYPGKIVKLYTSESTPEEKAELSDVNTHWKSCDVLIYTSTISAGISFDVENHFDYLCGFFNNHTIDYMSATQMLNRVRSISTKKYLLSFVHVSSGKMVSHDTDNRLYNYYKMISNYSGNSVFSMNSCDVSEKRVYDRSDLFKFLVASNSVYSNTKSDARLTASILAERYMKHEFFDMVSDENNKISADTAYNMFEKFIECIAAEIFSIRFIPDKIDPEERKTINEGLSAISTAITDKQNTDVAQSEPLSPEEYESMKDSAESSNVSTSDRLSMKKYKFCKFFRIPQSKLTPEIFGDYSSKMNTFLSLNTYRNSDESITINEKLKAYHSGVIAKLPEDTEDKSWTYRFQSLLTKSHFARHQLIWDILTFAEFADPDVISHPHQLCGIDFMEKKLTQSKTDILSILDGSSDKIGYICKEFGIKKSRFISEKSTTKAFIGFVNTLVREFDISLKLSNNRKKIYQFVSNGSFVWNDDLSMYVVNQPGLTDLTDDQITQIDNNSLSEFVCDPDELIPVIIAEKSDEIDEIMDRL